MENHEKWMELCAPASTEQDPAKLLALSQEIARLLGENVKQIHHEELEDGDKERPSAFSKIMLKQTDSGIQQLHGAGERTQDQQLRRRLLVDRPQCEQSQRNCARRPGLVTTSRQASRFPLRLRSRGRIRFQTNVIVHRIAEMRLALEVSQRTECFSFLPISARFAE
jgi:hypothetical protein